jgi:hypothetical protein
MTLTTVALPLPLPLITFDASIIISHFLHSISLTVGILTHTRYTPEMLLLLLFSFCLMTEIPLL